MIKTTRREFLKTTGATLLSSSVLGQLASFQARGATADSPAKAPNLIYVFVDQMRACSLGAWAGGDPVQTPHLERFASQGVNLCQAVSTYPVCSPYRAMLMSGRYPHRNTVLTNITSDPKRNYQLRDDQICLTDTLSQAGYHVGYIGKWHLTRPYEPYLKAFQHGKAAVWNDFTPPKSRHRIDYWYGYNSYDEHLRPVYWDQGAARDDFRFVDQWSPEHETDKAIAYLEKHSKSPFALFLSHDPPHPPFRQVPPKYQEIYKDAGLPELLKRGNVQLGSAGAKSGEASVRDYFAAISGIDTQFGRLLEAVDRLGLSENTLVIFTSDHGEMMGSHGRMHKNIWYDEAFRVPFLLRFPGRLAANKKDDLLIGTPDISATLLGLLGISSRIPDEWQGVDYSGALLGKSKAQARPRPESQLYWFNGVTNETRGIRTSRYTFAFPGKRGETRDPLLYDNQEDPFQLRSIAAEKPALVKDLTGLLFDSCRRIEDPWTPERA